MIERRRQSEPHPSRRAGCKNTIGQLFPETNIRAFSPNLTKLTEPSLNLFSPRPVIGDYTFNCYRFLIALHFVLLEYGDSMSVPESLSTNWLDERGAANLTTRASNFVKLNLCSDRHKFAPRQ